MNARWTLLMVFILALGLGAGLVRYFQWRAEGFLEYFEGGIMAEVISEVSPDDLDASKVIVDDVVLDRSRGTFTARLGIKRFPFEVAGTKIMGASGDYASPVSGSYVVGEPSVSKVLGFPLTRPHAYPDILDDHVDPAFSGGEASEEAWGRKQTINEMFDGFVGFGLRDPSVDPRYPIFCAFVARGCRERGDFETAWNVAEYVQLRYPDLVAKLPRKWADRLAKEKELAKTESQL